MQDLVVAKSRIFIMENAEEVMQLLEEFSKIKPKDIPRELEDYLGYVAKTGDPVFQWSLVRCLFREKLLNVITDFYESTLTVELPPCPNVEPFNYERMKTSLLERFDTFSSAPFTVQRICELLTNPRKEYNRADKYMRAIEKNILVVSTREPGSGKRPLEIDGQSETVLNGIPDMKLHETDGGFLHVPTELPYLGAPPASNDVTVETTESQSDNLPVSENINLDINRDVNTVSTKPDLNKQWEAQESTSLSLTAQKLEQNVSTPETLDEQASIKTDDDVCDISVTLTENHNSPSISAITEHNDSERHTSVLTQITESVLPDSIDSSNLTEEVCRSIDKKDSEQTEIGNSSHSNGNDNDENEVSSTPAEVSVSTPLPLIQEEIEEPDSEAEATNTGSTSSKESEHNSVTESEVNSSDKNSVQTEEVKSITICEITLNKENEIDLECNEISGTIDSPISPTDSSSQVDELVEQSIQSSESETPEIHPDSSNDVCLQNKSLPIETCSEADSLDVPVNSIIEDAELQRDKNLIDDLPDQSSCEAPAENAVVCVSSPNLPAPEKECEEKEVVAGINLSSSEVLPISEAQCSNLSEEKIKLAVIESNTPTSSEMAEEMSDPERREASVIQSVPNISLPDSQQQITVEEISVDPSCETEEEAMDVDDSSNQMMVSEGENEGEPMDQCDQQQS